MAVQRWILVMCCGLVAIACPAAEPQVVTPAAKTAVTPAESGKVQVDAQRLGNESQSGAVEAWLRHMRERNPEEYERLSKLRTENPEAFQKVLKERLARMREGKMEDLPHVKAFMEKMPAEEREQFLKRLREGGGKIREEWAKHNANLNKFEQEARKLVEDYKKADSDNKKKLRADLKKNVSDTFELREKARQEVIQRMEGQLVKLKKDSEKRKADRDAIVETRLKELLSETPPPK